MSDLASRMFTRAIQSMADLEYLPSYRFNVDPDKVRPAEIIEPYSTSEQMVCAIATCHHKHQNGFVVRMADQSLSNFGKDCGRRHFGDEFADLTRTFTRIRETRDQDMLLDAFKHRLPTMLEAVEALIEDEGGVRWLHGAIGSLADVLPPKTYSELLRMSSQGREVLVEERERSKADLEFIRNTAGEREAERQRFISIEVGRLRRVNVISSNPRSLAVERLKTPLKQLSQVADLRALTGAERKQALSLARDADRLLAQCSQILAYGHEFFTPEHVSSLRRLAFQMGEQKAIKNLQFDRVKRRYVIN